MIVWGFATGRVLEDQLDQLSPIMIYISIHGLQTNVGMNIILVLLITRYTKRKRSLGTEMIKGTEVRKCYKWNGASRMFKDSAETIWLDRV